MAQYPAGERPSRIDASESKKRGEWRNEKTSPKMKKKLALELERPMIGVRLEKV